MFLEKTNLKVSGIAVITCYTYLGVDFSYNGVWDTHIKKLIQNGKQEVNH